MEAQGIQPAALTIMDVLSFVASVASLIVSLGAIWLSIAFYRMSMAASGATTEASKGIAASVERLEKLFDKLYSDTFSMMRDTVSDMRKHIWPEDRAEAEADIGEEERRSDERIGQLKKDVDAQVAQLLQSQRIADQQVQSLRHELASVIDRAIAGSRHAEIESRAETVRELVLRELRILSRTEGTVIGADLVDRLRDRVPAQRLLAEVEQLRREGIIATTSRKLGPNTKIALRVPVPKRDTPAVGGAWVVKGMCPDCGKWAYLPESMGDFIHCEHPLIHVARRG